MLTRIVKQAAALSDQAAVGFSTGKDSIVALDLCCRHFKKVTAFFMYVVPGLSFQDAYLRQAERRYGIEIIRLPHWSLSTAFQVNYYRPGSDLSAKTPDLTIVDVEAYLRAKTGATWFAYGQKKNDSLERRGMISACGGVDVKSRRLYPVGDYSDRQIFAYMKHRRLPVPVDYQLFGHSFGLLEPLELRQVREHFPADFAKIVKVFPEIEAAIARQDFYGQG
ncbi:phosphoadenosine phosphosulfate reductase family protein [Geminisphaera colitermitum]|uniref:phosphoadenosine phosphosulfate reductase domain-containing protein n=1 Tax=Geminisphaera colitermitum TaxID=1148786 RepID=UPI000158D0FD|nr:phosphoadenosine phosphosulfate reductase family protein [Geminisphaera colitermitum]